MIVQYISKRRDKHLPSLPFPFIWIGPEVTVTGPMMTAVEVKRVDYLGVVKSLSPIPHQLQTNPRGF